MSGRNYDRSVTLLVWALVAIGLVAGAITNGLVGWTLLDLNRERMRLLEQDRRLNQDANRLHRLSQEIRGGIVTLLQGGEEAGALPHGEFAQLLTTLREDVSGPLQNELQAAAAAMAGLHRQAQEWRERYRAVADDLQQKRTLGQARALLEALRGGAESLEGQLRLEEAILLRRWRLAQGAEAAPLAAQVLEKQSHGRVRMLKEIRTEIADLARLVETLAGEDQLDYLADLRDNQLKPVLERLERQVGILALELKLPEGLTPQAIADLRDILFGRGHAIVAEYQTIRLGDGGLFRLASDALALRREREELQEEAQVLFAAMESIHPTLAALAGERSRALAHHAEESLSAGLQKLLLVNLLFLIGFLALGWLISRRVRHQVLTLAQLRRQNELILNSAGEGILGLDRQGRATFINPAGARLLGSEPAAMLGRDHRELLRHHFDDCPSLETSSIATVLAIGTAFHLTDELFQRIDGGSFPGECTATPIRNEKGEIEGAVITLLDITLRKDAEAALQRSFAELEQRKEELDELNRRLEEKVEERTRLLEKQSLQLIQAQEELLRAEKLAAIGSLAAGVAHEINNPAAIIRGNVEILRRKLPADDPRREEVQEILKQIERISRITQELLTFARAQTIVPERVAINPLLEEILAQAAHQVPLGRIAVRCDLDATLPPLPADRERLRQVFTNLVINALQAMDGEGTLTVASRQRPGAIEVSVADTGPGLPAELRSKIFNPFFTTKPTGTGLGLSVSYGIVQALGGTIEVGGAEGQGAVFTIGLPLEPVRTAAVPESVRSEGSGVRRKT